MFKSNTLTDIL